MHAAGGPALIADPKERMAVSSEAGVRTDMVEHEGTSFEWILARCRVQRKSRTKIFDCSWGIAQPRVIDAIRDGAPVGQFTLP